LTEEVIEIFQDIFESTVQTPFVCGQGLIL
jgi:hypothetical protein